MVRREIKTELSFWDYKNQPQLTGTLVGTIPSKFKDTNGEPKVIYVLQTPNGNVNLPNTTVLDEKMQQVKEGWTVYIQCLGKPEGKRYTDFKVEVEDNEPPVEKVQ